MKVLFVNEAGVNELLPMSSCVALMRETLATLSRGDVVMPLRSKVWLPDQSGILGLMPGYLGSPAAFGLKVITFLPRNHGTAYESHQGVVMLFGVEHGEPLAVMDASAITAIRTAAASGAATEALAREDAGDLAILGSGTQARTHLEAMRVVRKVRRVRVWSRSRANAEAFARNQAEANGPPIEVCATAEDAVRGADLICTTTAAKEPVLEGAWLAPGAHVNAAGACFRNSRELDTAAMKRARVFTDSRESCMNEAGDFLIARDEGAFGDDHLRGEIGEVFLGRMPGRASDDDVTVYESLGVAVEDLASAQAILERARARGKGQWLEWGGPA
jgi:ornithine cyclodeaminase